MKGTDCHVIYINKPVKYDPSNDTENNEYQEVLKALINEKKLNYLFDLHGMKNRPNSDIDLGTGYFKNVNYDKELVYFVRNLFRRKVENTTQERIFAAAKQTTTVQLNQSTGVQAIQAEISMRLRQDLVTPTITNPIIVSAFTNVIEFLKVRDARSKLSLDKLEEEKIKYIDNVRYINIQFPKFGFEIMFKIDTKENSLVIVNEIINHIFAIASIENVNKSFDDLLGDYNYTVNLDPNNELDKEKVQQIFNLYLKVKSTLKFYDFIKLTALNVSRINTYKNIYSESFEEFENKYNNQEKNYTI